MTKKILFIFLLFISFSIFAEDKKTILFWLSIDGMKFDYIEKTESPHFKELLSKSFYSKKLRPIFPSITFPSHTALATGVRVKDHGISLNTFYDQSKKEIFSYPGESHLLEAEPIWQTVKRSGLRSAVIDWPLSYDQKEEFKSDYFENKYNKLFSDEERINHALGIWNNDLERGNQYNLFMAYMSEVDSAGHEYGPDSEDVFKRVEIADQQIRKIMDKIKSESEKHPDYEYYFLITSDHGMEHVKFGVNLDLLLNLPPELKIQRIPGGPIAHLFLGELSRPEKNKWLRYIKARVSEFSFIEFYEKTKLPSDWGYDHKSRVGDVVLKLKKGYNFAKHAQKMISPIEELLGPRGTHGYDPKTVDSMNGLFILWKYPFHPKKGELNDPVSALQVHPTVAHLLKVKPSSDAKAKIIKALLR